MPPRRRIARRRVSCRGLNRIQRARAVEHGRDVIERGKAHLVARFHGRARHVRREKHVVERGETRIDVRLAAIDIEARAAQLSRRQRRIQRVFIDETAARRIHEDRPLRQASELARRHQRRAAAGHVQRQYLAVRQHGVETFVIRRAVFERGRRALDIRIDHAHAEPLRAPRDRAPDPPEADDAERLAVHARAEHVGHAERFAPARAHDALVFRGAAAGRQHEQHREIGGAFGQRIGRVGHDDAACVRRRHVHMIDARTRVRDDLQRRRQRSDVLGLQARLLADQHGGQRVLRAELDHGPRVHVGVGHVGVKFGFRAFRHGRGDLACDEQSGALSVRHRAFLWVE
ncbi:hypothetical protein PT2222_70126 [Paraburkholderia tropica]